MNRILRTAGLILLFSSLSGMTSADTAHKMKDKDHAVQMNKGMSKGMIGEKMLAIPRMDPVRGRNLFAEKGCVVCHSINGVGGKHAPPLDASTMQSMMNPFDFAAKMWRGAEAMVALQREELGEPIELTGQELADIIAFVHSHKEQAIFSNKDLPKRMMDLMDHSNSGEHGHEN